VANLPTTLAYSIPFRVPLSLHIRRRKIFDLQNRAIADKADRL